MQTLHILYHLALADLRERTRRYSFLILLGMVVYLGYLVFTGDLSLRLNNYRGEINSAWVGTMMSLVVNFFLGIFGFYLINNCIDRDIKTGVGQIIATTPIRKIAYLTGKWLSNLLVLGVMLVILGVIAMILLLIKGNRQPLDAWALLAPLIFVSIPSLAFTAAFAILFETIPWLRGGVGNVVYFFMYMFLIAISVGSGDSPRPNDFMGWGLYYPSLSEAVQARFGVEHLGMSLSISPGRQMTSFPWSGISWTLSTILPRLGWVAIAFGMVLAASLFFNRFDPSSRGWQPRTRKDKASAQDQAEGSLNQGPSTTRSARSGILRGALSWLDILNRIQPRTRFGSVLLAELRMLLKGQPWWWWAVMAGIILAGAASPLEEVRYGLLPAAWIWPLLVWSGMGGREQRYNTHQMIFSAENPLFRQLPAAWLAGVLVTALAGAGGLLALLLHGDMPGLLRWGTAILFIPSLALALGIWSGGSKPFEIFYLLWWYMGPTQRAAGLDFINEGSSPHLAATPLLYLAITLVLIAAAWAGRWRKIQG
jgi:hypothetical protein